MSRERLVSALGVAAALGAGLIVLQRRVAETKTAAIILVAIWFALVGLVAIVVTSRRPEIRLAVLGTFAGILAATVAIGYVTGFRDTKVDEDVVVAAERVPDTERDAALAANPEPALVERRSESEKPAKPAGPIELAKGDFTGADGHAGSGVATVVRDADGSRSLTFTDFDVDPGATVVVWLTQDGEDLEDRIELGGLKGNFGDQAYDVPDDADLRKYDTVVLYCTPFTVRIAVAPLG